MLSSGVAGCNPWQLGSKIYVDAGRWQALGGSAAGMRLSGDAVPSKAGGMAREWGCWGDSGRGTLGWMEGARGSESMGGDDPRG